LPDDAATSDKIRILIVDDNPDTRENVSRLLYFEDNLEVIGQAVNGRHGIEMAAELKPHVVLMDINMPDMDGITATQKMSVDVPYCQVIIMSVQAEQDYMKRAMAAGARDFQPKPFTADELINCIHRVYQIGIPVYQKLEAAEQAEAQVASTTKKVKKVIEEGDAPVIAVYSGKGGVGTSVVATNLAVALQQYRGDVALVDADLQFGDISVNLNTRPNRTIADLVHEGEVDVELIPDVVLSHDTGLKLLLSPAEPQLADTILPEMVGDIVKEMKNLFKAIVIDTNSQLNDVTLNVLEHADYVLVVTAPELPAIKSAKSFLELAVKLEFPAEKLGVIINRANEPGGVRPGQIAKVLKLQKQPYLVPDEARLHLAMYKGVTIIQEDPNGPAAKAFLQTATDIWQILAGPEEEELMDAEVVA
jgi:pilus assembly protein CpaE